MRIFVLLLCVLVLSSCVRARAGYDRMAKDYRLMVNGLDSENQGAIVKDTPLNYPEISPGEHHASEHTYCYRVQTDILCYSQPIPGKENLMVGYQVPEYTGTRTATLNHSNTYSSGSAPSQYSSPIRLQPELNDQPVVQVSAPPSVAASGKSGSTMRKNGPRDLIGN